MSSNKIVNKSTEIAIVVIAYNRLSSIRRLLKSIIAANYFGDVVDLVISIDNSGSREVVDYAQAFVWPNGRLIIIEHEIRLGLKQHVLKCGELTKKYENICVFEDDLYASPGFYSFAKSAARHFKDFDRVAGISLYTHQWNPYVNRPFVPIQDGHDVFLLQVASSWGQVWSTKEWSSFMEWMVDKTDQDLHSHLLPKEVSNWSIKSWLKFHNKYLVDTGKFFVYPREGLSTNFSDAGEHAIVNTVYQVPILISTKLSYNFPIVIDDCIKYDAFFEYLDCAKYLKVEEMDLDVSLYGNKFVTKKYLLTTQQLKCKKIKSFGLKMRPIELNIIFQVEGESVILYDTTRPCKSKSHSRSAQIMRFLYDIRIDSKKELLLGSVYLYVRAAFGKLRRLF